MNHAWLGLLLLIKILLSLIIIYSLINLDQRSGSWNSIDDLSKKVCVPCKIKDVNVEVFRK